MWQLLKHSLSNLNSQYCRRGKKGKRKQEETDIEEVLIWEQRCREEGKEDEEGEPSAIRYDLIEIPRAHRSSAFVSSIPLFSLLSSFGFVDLDVKATQSQPRSLCPSNTEKSKDRNDFSTTLLRELYIAR
ncbi:hypothetical protein ABKV19_012033 [Rosa sericea]